MTLHPLAERYRDLFERPRQFVFLVTHMRSYSSLLGHLLAETDAIDGYSELHQTYTSELDLVRMPLDVQATHDRPLRGDYVFDKLLHRAYTIDPALAGRADVRIIFSIRTPLPTLASMVELGLSDRSVKWAAEPDRALLHYQRRLSDICALAEWVPRGAFLVSNDLVASPRPTLDSLGEFLGLDESIPERYSMQPRTGVKKFGDSSDRILAGEIRSDHDNGKSTLPAEVIAAGQAAFSAALSSKALRRLTPIGDPEQYR